VAHSITGSVEAMSKLDSDFPKGVLGISANGLKRVKCLLFACLCGII